MGKTGRSYIKKFAALFLFFFSCFLCAIAYNASGIFNGKKAVWPGPPRIFVDVNWPLKNDFNTVASVEIEVSKIKLEEEFTPEYLSKLDDMVKKDPALRSNYEQIKKSLVSSWQYRRKLGKANMERLWSENGRARNIIADYASSYIPAKHASLDNIGFAKKMLAGWNSVYAQNDYYLFNIALGYIYVSMSAAAERGYFEYAMCADIAWLRAHRALFYGSFYGVPQIWESESKYYGQSMDSKSVELLRNIYINNNDITRDKDLMATAEIMLKKRLAFMETGSRISEMIKGAEFFYAAQAEADMSMTQKIMRKSLDMWYGDTRAHYAKFADDIEIAEKKGFLEVAKTVRSFEDIMKGKKTIGRELADSPEGLTGMLMFLRKALTVHPLASFEYRQYIGRDGFHIIFTDFINDRLLAAAAMSRIFHARNKRWPKYDSDKDFFKELSIAAIDPVDNLNLKMMETPGGGLKIYSIGIDGRDDGGDEKKDSVITVKAPVLK